MPILNLKPLIFSLLNLFGLNSPTPEIRDIAIALRHSSLMHSLIRTLQDPELLVSLQQICKEELPPQLAKIMEIPVPDLETLQVPTNPIVTAIFEGKRRVNIDLYEQLYKEATTLLDSEYSKVEKYENFCGNSIQFSIYKCLRLQLEEQTQLDKELQIQDPIFKKLLHIAFDFTDLACIVNAKKDNQSQAFPIMEQAFFINHFLRGISKYEKDCESIQQYENIIRSVCEINIQTLFVLEKLNTITDELDAQCNTSERYLILHLLKRSNKVTQGLCLELASLLKEISLNRN